MCAGEEKFLQKSVTAKMLRNTGKRRALSVLEKREICRKRLEPKHAKEKLSEFGKNFTDNQVGSL